MEGYLLYFLLLNLSFSTIDLIFDLDLFLSIK